MIIALIWILCGIASAGIFVGFFQGEYPTLGKFRQDLGTGLLLGLLFGPVALVVFFFLSGFVNHGWRLWRK